MLICLSTDCAIPFPLCDISGSLQFKEKYQIPATYMYGAQSVVSVRISFRVFFALLRDTCVYRGACGDQADASGTQLVLVAPTASDSVFVHIDGIGVDADDLGSSSLRSC